MFLIITQPDFFQTFPLRVKLQFEKVIYNIISIFFFFFYESCARMSFHSTWVCKEL